MINLFELYKWKNEINFKLLLALLSFGALTLPLMLLYLVNYKYSSDFVFDFASVKYLMGWITQRLHVHVGSAVFLIENSFLGANYLNGFEIQIDALRANFCKLRGCQIDADYKSVNQYVFSLFYSGLFSKNSPGVSPLPFGSSVLMLGYWLGPIGASILINGMSHLFSGWHIFFARNEVIKVAVLYVFMFQFLFFSPLSLVNIIDPYFVRVLIFAVAPMIFLALTSKGKVERA